MITNTMQVQLGIDPTALQADIAEAHTLDGLTWEPITSKIGLETTRDLLQSVVQKKDALETMRQTAVGPMNQALKAINGWFRPAVGILDAFERTLKGCIATYLRQEQAEYTRAMQAATQAHTAGEQAITVQALAVANATVERAPAGVGVRQVWHATVINEGMLPREFLVPNVTAINAHARNTKPSEQPYPIPGVRFDLVDQVSVRR